MARTLYARSLQHSALRPSGTATPYCLLPLVQARTTTPTYSCPVCYRLRGGSKRRRWQAGRSSANQARLTSAAHTRGQVRTDQSFVYTSWFHSQLESACTGAYPNARNPMHVAAPCPRLLGRLPDPQGRETSRETPAPGTYNISGGLGKQVISTRSSARSASFGVGSRPPAQVADKHGCTAAPGEYALRDSMGSQALSTKPSARAATIRSRRQQPTKPASNRTGPGCYAVQQAMGKQVSSRHRSGPAASLSGRTKFGSPYYI